MPRKPVADWPRLHPVEGRALVVCMETETIPEAAFWSRRQAAAHLGVTVRSFDRLRHQPGFPARYRFGGAVRYRTDEVRAWADAQRPASALVIPEVQRGTHAQGVPHGPRRRAA